MVLSNAWKIFFMVIGVNRVYIRQALQETLLDARVYVSWIMIIKSPPEVWGNLKTWIR